ncbi:transferrin-binding protein-like solute binding protein [Thiovibrio sp. JS02]
MRHHRLFLLFLISAGFFFSPWDSVQAQSEDAVATVVALRGEVLAVNKAGKSRKLAMKNPIYQDDTINTGERGRVQLMFTDSTLISLGNASKMKIAEFSWQPEKNRGALKTQIQEGAFRVMGGAITKASPQNFKTETPSATIGIRGSMYSGVASPEKLSVVFQGGKGIEVSNALGTVVITKPGWGTHVTGNQQPQPPTKFTSADLETLDQALAGTGVNGDEQTAADGETAAPEAEGEEEGQATDGDAAASEEQQTDEAAPAEEGAAPAEEEAAPAEDDGTSAPIDDTVATPEESAPPATETVSTDSVATDTTTTTTLTTTVTTVTPPPSLPPTNELPSAPTTTTTTTSLPTEGIAIFSGGLSGTGTNYFDGTTETIVGDMHMEVNWYNKKAFGAVFDPSTTSGELEGPPVFFFGTVTGTGLSGIKIFGSGGDPDLYEISFIEGSGSGLFVGTSFEYSNLTASGYDYLIKPLDQPVISSWQVQAATTKQPQDPVDVTSPRGSALWQGFVVGISEDMSDPNNARRIFMNSAPDQFSMTVNKDAGTLSGTINTDYDMNGYPNQRITGLTVGGAYGSAYITDDMMAAILGCSGGCVDSATLKPHGNYLVIEDPANQFSPYFTWGYWEIAYTDPNDSTPRHVHVPHSMWLSGKPATDAVIRSGFAGTYSGYAVGSKIDVNGVQHLKGTCNLTADFNSSTVSGNISFPDIATLTLGPTYVFDSSPTGNSFTAYLGGDGTSGNVNGTFYGDLAQAVGGNFYSAGSGKQYVGIFGGNRK